MSRCKTARPPATIAANGGNGQITNTPVIRTARRSSAVKVAARASSPWRPPAGGAVRARRRECDRRMAARPAARAAASTSPPRTVRSPDDVELQGGSGTGSFPEARQRRHCDRRGRRTAATAAAHRRRECGTDADAVGGQRDARRQHRLARRRRRREPRRRHHRREREPRRPAPCGSRPRSTSRPPPAARRASSRPRSR